MDKNHRPILESFIINRDDYGILIVILFALNHFRVLNLKIVQNYCLKIFEKSLLHLLIGHLDNWHLQKNNHSQDHSINFDEYHSIICR